MRALLALLGMLSLISGCAVSPETAAELLSLSSVCAQYGHALRAGAVDRQTTTKAEIDRRGLTFTDAEGRSIYKETVHVGMSECAMYAAWGHPSRQNKTFTAGGETVQHVWAGVRGRYIGTRSNYAYTSNGRVTAVQTP